MRALGPGSMSSLLKIALDVAYWVLWLATIATALATVIVTVAAPFMTGEALEEFQRGVEVGSGEADVTVYLPFVIVALFTGLAYVVALLAIVGRLRRIAATLTAGDPFRPENVRRLRFVGFCLAGLIVLGYLAPVGLAALNPDPDTKLDVDFDLTAWFAVLVVFVLAEVFREGARLRGDAELTI